MESVKLSKELNAILNDINKSLSKIDNETVKANELKEQFEKKLKVSEIKESTKFVGTKYSYTRTVVHTFDNTIIEPSEKEQLDALYKAYKDYENILKEKYGNTKVSGRNNYK